MIRLLIVHEAPVFCRIIKAALVQESDIEIIGTATSAEEALQQAELCDIALICATLPDGGALALTQSVSQMEIAGKVLIMGIPEAQEMILRYVKAGASGYVLQDASMDEFLANIRTVYRGEALASPQVVAAMMSHIADLTQLHNELGYKVEAAQLDELTPREAEVLHFIGTGLNNQEIADQLSIELGTVKNHVHNLLQKLNVRNRWDAAPYAALLESKDILPPHASSPS
jgi:DNA-binding NarL/FixJ family response regulator